MLNSDTSIILEASRSRRRTMENQNSNLSAQDIAMTNHLRNHCAMVVKSLNDVGAKGYYSAIYDCKALHQILACAVLKGNLNGADLDKVKPQCGDWNLRNAAQGHNLQTSIAYHVSRLYSGTGNQSRITQTASSMARMVVALEDGKLDVDCFFKQ